MAEVYAPNRMWRGESPELCRLCDEQPTSRALIAPICATCAWRIYNLMAVVLGDQPRPEPGPPPPRDEVHGHVYYVRRGDLIKIGFSVDLRSRMSTLLPDEILAVEPGTFAIERMRHRQFAPMRADGHREWFYDCDELRQHIADMLVVHGEPPTLPTLARPA